VTINDVERRFVEWAHGQEDVRAAILVGSRSRVERPADEWSDLDIVVFARRADDLLERDDWVHTFGDVRITFLEETAEGGGRERRVFYADGADADFAVFSTRRLLTLIAYLRAPRAVRDRLPAGVGRELESRAAGFGDVLGRGPRILVDKDGLLARLIELLPPRQPPRLPTTAELDEVVSDFWYHAIWATKKLRRGEVFTAKLAVDGYLKRLMLRMAEWHARAGDPATDTWHQGRFIEGWSDPRVVDALGRSYAHYRAEDVARALAESMDLFSWLARETAERLGVPYPATPERTATEWIAATARRAPDE